MISLGCRAVSAHPDHRKLQEDAAPEPLRVLIHYDEDHIELEPHEYDALATRLGPLLTAVIETTFSVLRPDAGPSLLLPRRCLSSWSDGTCSEVAPIGTCLAATPPPSFYGPATTCSNGPSSSPRICDTVAGGEGAGDYNFVLFVTATDSIGGESTCDGEVFALGAPCELSVVDGHPVAGSINICPNAIRVSHCDPISRSGHSAAPSWHRGCLLMGRFFWMDRLPMQQVA